MTNLPEFEGNITALNFKCWFLREMNGFSDRAIAKELGINYTNVSRYVKGFRENYRRIYDLVIMYGDKPLQTTARKKKRVMMLERLRAGYHWGTPPFGYSKKQNGELEEIPEKLKLIPGFFLSIDEGKSVGQLSREAGLLSSSLNRILRNPVYKGFVRLKSGETAKGRHRAIVDPELFDRVQEKLVMSKFEFGPNRPYGVLYFDDNGDPVWDEKKFRQMEKAITLRLEGKSFEQIAKKFGWQLMTTHHRIRNPFYCGMKRQDGKLVRAHGKPVVKIDMWRAANDVKIMTGERGQNMKRIARDDRNKVLGCFNGKSELTTREIANQTTLCQGCVLKQLAALEKDGMIERVRYKRRITDPYKWRRKF
jgi:transcriptional regulator with XRE-family HTH domain